MLFVISLDAKNLNWHLVVTKFTLNMLSIDQKVRNTTEQAFLSQQTEMKMVNSLFDLRKLPAYIICKLPPRYDKNLKSLSKLLHVFTRMLFLPW